MILDEKNYNVTDNLGATCSEDFVISNTSKMFDILSNKIYEDPIRAVVRELCCNAIDAHIEALVDVPLNVYLPTPSSKTLVIEDFGIGMTHEDVMTVYKSYGNSTKSSSDKMIGALGLGGKTPLAYTSQFTLETAKGGSKNRYVVFKNDNGIPNVAHISQEASDETGTRIELLVQEADIILFHKAAVKTFAFFDEMPNIQRGEDLFFETVSSNFPITIPGNLDELKKIYNEARDLFKEGILGGPLDNYVALNILNSYGEYTGIIMGQVFYAVNVSQILKGKYGDKSENIFYFPFPNIGKSQSKKILNADAGEVSFLPSREALHYNEKTIRYLQGLFYNAFDNWHDNIQENYDTPRLFLENFQKIEHSFLLSYFDDDKFPQEDREAHDLKDIAFLKGLYLSCVELLKNILDKGIAYEVYPKFKTWRITGLNGPGQHVVTDEYKYIFIKLAKNMFTHILMVDEKRIAEKLDNGKKCKLPFHDSFSIPIDLKRKLDLTYAKHVLIAAQEAADKLGRFFNIPVLKTSELLVPKVKRAKAPVKRAPEHLIWRYCNNTEVWTYVSLEDALAHKGFKTYEIFQGDPNSHGTWYYPNFALINDAAKIVKKNHLKNMRTGVVYKYQGHEIYKLEPIFKYLGLDLPEAHYIVNWDFFKRHLTKDNEWVYINDWVANKVRENIAELANIFLTENKWGVSLYTKALACEILEEGKRYLNFEGTLLGKECERVIKESLVPERSFRNNDNHSISLHTLIEKLNTRQDFKDREDLLKKLLKIRKKISANHNSGSSNQVSYEPALLERYPMLEYTKIKTRPSVEKIVGYAALVENLQ